MVSLDNKQDIRLRSIYMDTSKQPQSKCPYSLGCFGLGVYVLRLGQSDWGWRYCHVEDYRCFFYAYENAWSKVPFK